MVKYGIDTIDSHPELFSGRRLGLITSVSGTTSSLRSTVDVLNERYGLSALFAPEHGVRGNLHAGQSVDTYTDEVTGLPVFSLYSEHSKRLSLEMLEAVDTVVYDIQDIGARYYTFISTLLYALEDCAKHGRELVVLDRPNPLGDLVEGNILETAYKSFVGAYPICMRYGLTAGELAIMTNDELALGCALTVVPTAGWKRRELFPDTKNCWLMPSLGIPRFETALLYPGTCLFEGTNLSEGRGTTCPFEIIGAPYINAHKLSSAANAMRLPGIIFTPAYFTPTFSKHQGTPCEGVHLHVTDSAAFEPVSTAVRLLYLIRECYQSFAFLPPVSEGGRAFISLLAGSGVFESNDILPCDELLAQYAADSAAFAKRKQKYHIYD